ncbi:ABC transporter permease [Uliginosibacterium sp. H1]|uniref:ABC transporter permease n=1 Tax=Uliginosibacterium sp. H1 TaxID=3114757 RepID=UPI002E18E847|nr:ABC transporter permease [Uliginosibacterium sp. H1]
MNWIPPLDLAPRRAAAVWRRNFKVWRRLAIPSLLGNLADPLIYLLGLGFGLGALLPDVGGVSYITFLATGTVAFSTMNAATFEALYSGFARMHQQKTWETIMNGPMSLDDVMVGELMWAATKSLFSGGAILLVIAACGLVSWQAAIAALPLVLLTGFCFAGLGYIATALAPGYDFFMYWFTLFISPMAMLSGVFFPLDQLPTALRLVTDWLPLSHAIALMRPLLLGEAIAQPVLHLAALAAYGLAGFAVARALMRRRLLR